MSNLRSLLTLLAHNNSWKLSWRPSIRNRVLCNRIIEIFKIFFHAKFDNFKDETISDYKTVSVPQSQILAGLKTLGLVGL